MTLRRAVPEDYDRLLPLFLGLHELHQNNRPDLFLQDANPRPRTYFERTLLDPTMAVIVAEEKGKFIGYATGITVIIPEGTPLVVPRTYVLLEDIFVDPKARKKGVGKALLAEVESFARSQGASSVELKVYHFDDSALTFYEKMGLNKKSTEMEIKL